MAAPPFVTKLTTGKTVQPPHLRDRVGAIISPRAPVEARAHVEDVMTGREHIAPTNSNRTCACASVSSAVGSAVDNV